MKGLQALMAWFSGCTTISLRIRGLFTLGSQSPGSQFASVIFPSQSADLEILADLRQLTSSAMMWGKSGQALQNVLL